MGLFNKTIKLSMDYSSFDGGVTEINRKMKQLDSEFKLAKESAKSFGDEQTQLELDMQHLAEKIELQTKKVNATKEAYENATTGGKATDKQLDRLKQSYLDSQVSLAKLNSELKECEDKLSTTSDIIENTDRKMKLLDSEFALTKESTKLFADEQTKLENNVNHLSEKIELQTKKVNATKEAYEKANSEGQTSEKQLDKLKQSYVDSQIALAEMNNKLTDSRKKLEDLKDGASDTTQPMNDLGNAFDGGKDSAVDFAAKMYIVEEAVKVVKDAVMGYADFDSSISKINTLADKSVVSLKDLKKGVYEIAKQTGQGAKDIAESMYEALSANVETADAFEVTLSAAKLAKAGFTDTATAVNVLTTIMNSYQMSADEATTISDKLLKVQDLGKTTVGEFGDSFGKVAGLAKEAGVSLDEILGAVATLTKVNGSAGESITALKSGISNIIKPTAEASELAKQLGLKFNATALESQGLANFLENVQKKTKGNTETMAKLFGSVEALNAVLILTGSGADSFASDLENIENASGSTEESLDNLKGSGNNFKDSIENVKTTLIQLGDALSPIIDFITFIFNIITKIPAPIYIIIAALALLITVIKNITAIKTAWAAVNTIASTSVGILSGTVAISTASMLKFLIAITAIVAVIGLVVGSIKSVKSAMQEATDSTSQLTNQMNNIKGVEANVKTSYTASQYNASGTDNFAGGRTWVGENGPELITLPQGSKITPSDKVDDGGNYIFNVTIDAKNVKDFNDVVKVCMQKKQANRRGVL